MSLSIVRGEARKVNQRLMQAALSTAPAVFVDPANCANIHTISDAPDEKLRLLFIVPAESLYRFKPTLLKLPALARRANTSRLFISTIPHLFDYDNADETAEILKQCWDIIRQLAKHHEVAVGIVPNTVHERLSKARNIKRNNMGHTVWSQRIVVDVIIKDLAQYSKALREEDRLIYNNLLKLPLKHVGSISYTSSQQAWAFFLISIMIEQEKKIKNLELELKMMKGDEHGCLASGCIPSE